MRMRSLQPPRLRTLETEGHRTATWLELFYDLAFVAAVAVLGVRLAGVDQAGGVWVYLGFLLLIWWLWVSHTFYADRYDTDDLIYRILATVQLVAVAVIAASLSGDALSTFAFAVGYTLARLVLLAMYWRARIHLVETRALVTGYLVGFGLGATLWAISIVTPEPARYVLWAAAFAVDLATPWVMRREQARVSFGCITPSREVWTLHHSHPGRIDRGDGGRSQSRSMDKRVDLRSGDGTGRGDRDVVVLFRQCRRDGGPP